VKKKTVCLLFLFCCLGICTAQQVVSSGGHAVKSEIVVDWILGGSLTDIPTYDLASVNKIKKDQLMDSDISYKVYPNPASDFINIKSCRLILVGSYFNCTTILE